MLKLSLLFKKIQTSRGYNLRILRIENTIFLLLYEHEHIGRFSNLHYCNFNIKILKRRKRSRHELPFIVPVTK